MSLDWNLTAIANADEVCWETADYDAPMRGIKKGDRVMSPVTNTLIWATIACGMGRITADNADNFAARLRTYETMFGAFLQQPLDEEGRPATADHPPVRWVDRPITLAEVRAHVGLSTNVSHVTDVRWKRGLMDRAVVEAMQALAREEAPVDAAA